MWGLLQLLDILLGLGRALGEAITWLLSKKQGALLDILLTFGGNDDLRPCGYKTVRRGIRRLKYAQYIDNLKLVCDAKDQDRWYYIFFSPRLTNMTPFPLMNCTVTVTARKKEFLRFEPSFNSPTLQLTFCRLRWYYPKTIQPGESLTVEIGGQGGESVPICLLIREDGEPYYVLTLDIAATSEKGRTKTFRIRRDVVIKLDWPRKLAWILVPVTNFNKLVLPTREVRLNRYYLLNLPPEEKEKSAVLVKLKKLGPQRDSYAKPNELLSYRFSPDDSKIIVQANFF